MATGGAAVVAAAAALAWIPAAAPAHAGADTARDIARAEALLRHAQRQIVGGAGDPAALVRAGVPLARAGAALAGSEASSHEAAHAAPLAVRTARMSRVLSARVVRAATRAPRAVPMPAVRRAMLSGAASRHRAARLLSAVDDGVAARWRRVLAADLRRGARAWRVRARARALPAGMRSAATRAARIELVGARLVAPEAIPAAPRPLPAPAPAPAPSHAGPPAPAPAPAPSPPPPPPAPAPAAEAPPAPAPAPAAPVSEPVPQDGAEAEARAGDEPADAGASRTEFAVEVRAGIPYAHPERAPEGGLLADAYLPDSPGAARPAVVLVHGGAWRAGWRGHMATIAEGLARRGFPAIAIDYRKDGTRPFPEQYDDVRAALAWTRANATDLRIDPDRVALLGASAGGHLAAMVSATAAGDGIPGGRPAVLVSWSGVMDLRDMATDDAPRPGCDPAPVKEGGTCDLPRWVVTFMPRIMGAPIDDAVPWVGDEPRPEPEPALYDDNSPARHVTPGAPPSLLVHAESDPVVGSGQARAMVDALEAAGAPAHLLMVPGEGHANQLTGVAMPTTLSFLVAALGDPAL